MRSSKVTTILFDLDDTLFDHMGTARAALAATAAGRPSLHGVSVETLYQHSSTQRLGSGPAETVMVGDNWQADVVGALAVGIRPVWLNRLGVALPLPAVAELASLEPLATVYQLITNEVLAPVQV